MMLPGWGHWILHSPFSSFFSIFVNGIIIYPSFQTVNTGVAWDSPVFCALLITPQCLLDPCSLPCPTLKTRLSFFIGGPATGLYFLRFIFPTAARVPCWNSSVTWWFISSSPWPITTSFCYIVPSVPDYFYFHLFVCTVNFHLIQPCILFYLEALWLILLDLDLRSVLQWTLSWPSGRISCSTLSVPITYYSY